MRDGRDIVEIEGLQDVTRRAPDAPGGANAHGAVARQPSGTVRPWIGVFFRCCGVYARVYRDAVDPAYRGRCPRCMAQVRATVGPGGTAQRIFETQ